VEHPKDEVTVAIVGKYVEHKDAYKSLGEALRHGGIKQQTRVNLKWIDSEQIEAEGRRKCSASVDAILVPGGFGKRGFEGKMLAAKYAREHGVPYFGICYGMHAAVIDFARHVAGLTDADSSENDRNTPDPVIGLITEWTTATGEVEQRSERSDLGGTMRLGRRNAASRPARWRDELYGQDVVRERHRHRYEFNNRYRQPFEDLGHGDFRQVDGRPAGRNRRAADAEASVVPRLPGASGIHFHAARWPSAVHRFRPRCTRIQGRARRRELAQREPRMKLCGFEIGLDQPCS
jgi:CTP synthase